MKSDSEIFEVFAAEHDIARESECAPLSLLETTLSAVVAVTCVTISATFLVEEVELIVKETAVPETFMRLVLISIMEKAAEHTIAIDEAW